MHAAANMLQLTDTQCCGGFWQAGVCWEISFLNEWQQNMVKKYDIVFYSKNMNRSLGRLDVR